MVDNRGIAWHTARMRTQLVELALGLLLLGCLVGQVLLFTGCAGRVPNGTQELTYEYKNRTMSRQELQRLDDAAMGAYDDPR